METAHTATHSSIGLDKLWPWVRRRILFYLVGGFCGAAGAIIYALILTSHPLPQDHITPSPKNQQLQPSPPQNNDPLIAFNKLKGVPVIDKDRIIVGSIKTVITDSSGQPNEIIITVAGQMSAQIQVAFPSVEWNADHTSASLPFTLNEIRAGFAMVEAASKVAKSSTERDSVAVSYEASPGHYITLSRPPVVDTPIYQQPILKP